MQCRLRLPNQFKKSLAKPKEINGSEKSVRGSKEILESLRSERYLKILRWPWKTNRERCYGLHIKEVWGKTGKDSSIDIDRGRHLSHLELGSIRMVLIFDYILQAHSGGIRAVCS